MGFKSVVCKARAVNVLHCICVSGYRHHHHHHHHLYHYHHYYCISTQATSIIKRVLIGLACVAWAGNYQITGRARGTREGRGGLLSFSLLMRPRHFFFRPSSPPPNKTKQQQQQQQQNWRLLRRLWLALLWNVYVWVKARKETGGDGPGAGKMKVCLCYTDSSIMSSKMHKSRHLRKFKGIMQNWL